MDPMGKIQAASFESGEVQDNRTFFRIEDRDHILAHNFDRFCFFCEKQDLLGNMEQITFGDEPYFAFSHVRCKDRHINTSLVEDILDADSKSAQI